MSGHPHRKHSEVLRESLHLDGARVLDIGCGDGSLVRFLTREGARVTGLEIAEEKLARARAEPPAGDEDYRVGTAEALPFEDGVFDVAIFHNSLHHVPVAVQDAGLAEAARVLKPGGRLYVLEPLSEGPMDELMRPVDDETEVRRAAYAALGRAAAGPKFEQLRELTYQTTYRYASFDDFRSEIVHIDATRRAAFDAHEAEMRRLFDELGTPGEDGVAFPHPNRLNLLKRV